MLRSKTARPRRASVGTLGRMSLVAGTALVTLGALGAPTPGWAHGASGPDVVATGDFLTTATGLDRGFEIAGRAMLIRRGDGTTEAFTQVLGLDPLTDYASHVHDLPCALGGGAHYKIDPSVAGTVAANEIWPLLSTDGDGTGFGAASAAHRARPEAQSIVVHDGDGARIACADLVLDRDGAQKTRGAFHSFASGPDRGFDIRGVAQMVRSNGHTFVLTSVTGLAASTAYPSHVHNLPCDVLSGGGHYKIDPFEPATLQDNEIWPLLTSDGDGAAVGNVAVQHLARPEAQSVVVHDTDGARIACADLAPETAAAPHLSKGRFLTTATGTERGFSITGTALIVREGDGATTVVTEVAGLTRRTTFPSHVHNLPCRLGGGGHYKIDPGVAGTVEENEIWPTLRSNFLGRAIGFDRVRHTARPEAQSIVIHDPDDGARLACADLD